MSEEKLSPRQLRIRHLEDFIETLQAENEWFVRSFQLLIDGPAPIGKDYMPWAIEIAKQALEGRGK